MIVVKDDRAESFFSFLGEYTSFFCQMEQFEAQKLELLLSGELSGIEKAITTAQANAKQLENLEQKRIRLQQEAGFGAMSLRELADKTDGARKEQLRLQLHELSVCLGNIKFYNAKSMQVAQTNLRRQTAKTSVASAVAPVHSSKLEGKA
ncbi:MAG: hypothetical protein RR185_05875 [Angelakisella sp.]